MKVVDPKGFALTLRPRSGFTLIELLVVIAIIGLLSSIVFASLNSARGKARDIKRVSELNQLRTALELYYDKYGVYPNSTLSGSGCWSAWEAGNAVNGNAPFLQALVTNGFMSKTPLETSGIIDAWGSRCTYRYIREAGMCGYAGTWAMLYTALETNSTSQARGDERPGPTGCGEGFAGYDYAIYLKE